MAKRRVSFKLAPEECEALKAFSSERGFTISAGGRELIRHGLGMNGRQEIQSLAERLGIIEKRCRRAQIAAYRAYAGIVELIRFIARDDSRATGKILEALVEKSNETLRKEEDRGDYR